MGRFVVIYENLNPRHFINPDSINHYVCFCDGTVVLITVVLCIV